MSCRPQLKPGETCVAHVAPIAHSGPNELPRVAPIAHLGQIWGDELSSIAQALKTCADELPPIAHAGEKMCSSCSSYSSPCENMCRYCSSWCNFVMSQNQFSGSSEKVGSTSTVARRNRRSQLHIALICTGQYAYIYIICIYYTEYSVGGTYVPIWPLLGPEWSKLGRFYLGLPTVYRKNYIYIYSTLPETLQRW